MTLYTPYSEEIIFQEVDWMKAKPKKIINFEGVNLEVDFSDDGDAIVHRIISSDPQDYLVPELQPGSIIQRTFN